MATRLGIQLGELVNHLKQFAPLNLAGSWDNVGLLTAPLPYEPNGNINAQIVRSVLLTIDLTEAVAREAVSKSVDMVVAYHPPIFRPIKRLDVLNNWKDRAFQMCIAGRIAVYCPHTALDATRNGINDWLITALRSHAKPEAIEAASDETPDVGTGRVAELLDPPTLKEAVQSIKTLLGISHLSLVLGQGQTFGTPITQVAVCAGSGSSVLMPLIPKWAAAGVKTGLWITGEMSHHDQLYAAAAGISVAICGHTETERGYLSAVLKHVLDETFDGILQIHVSQADKSPFETL